MYINWSLKLYIKKSHLMGLMGWRTETPADGQRVAHRPVKTKGFFNGQVFRRWAGIGISIKRSTPKYITYPRNSLLKSRKCAHKEFHPFWTVVFAHYTFYDYSHDVSHLPRGSLNIMLILSLVISSHIFPIFMTQSNYCNTK